MCYPRGKGTPLHPVLQGITFLYMASTSINIQPCKIGSSEQHNHRTKELDYVRPELSHLNESWSSDNKRLPQHLVEIQRAYLDNKGKKMHAKATPIREGVIVIQNSTTMQDLQFFAQRCEERWGLKALQIHIHRDEGYMHAREWKPNLHAHIVWNWTDEKGVTRKLNRFDMVEMQSLLAETLQMERGVASDKKHLSSLQFKVEAEAQRLESLSEGIGEVENIREKIKNAVEAQIKPIEALIEENTTESVFRGRKVDFEVVIGQIQAQETSRAIVQVQRDVIKDEEIRSLKSRLDKSNKALERTRQVLSQRENEISFLAHFARGYFADGFEDFKSETEAYFLKVYGKVLEIAKIALMWAGKAFIDSRGTRYEADYERAKLLINGKTIEENEALEVTKKQQQGGVGIKR